MPIDYQMCVSAIRKQCRCSRQEAWDGMVSAYLTMDRGASDACQSWWLINIGALKVCTAVRETYTAEVGVKREVPLDGQLLPAADEWEWDFLNAFAEGYPRELARWLANGKHRLSVDSVRYWLRKRYGISAKTLPRQLEAEVRRSAARLIR